MIFILRNRSKRDCGIVAAFNASAWRGVGLTYKQIEKHARACGYNPKIGIRRFQFHRLIGKLNVGVKQVIPFTSLEKYEELLYAGYLILFLYQPAGMNWGHAISAFVDQNGEIILINPDTEHPTWEDFSEELNANGVQQFTAYAVPSQGIQNAIARTS